MRFRAERFVISLVEDIIDSLVRHEWVEPCSVTLD
jgi:hypothetical protein